MTMISIIIIVSSAQLLHSLTVHVHQDESISRLDSDTLSIVTSAVDDAVQYWSQTLRVRKQRKTILVGKLNIITPIYI